MMNLESLQRKMVFRLLLLWSIREQEQGKTFRAESWKSTLKFMRPNTILNMYLRILNNYNLKIAQWSSLACLTTMIQNFIQQFKKIERRFQRTKTNSCALINHKHKFQMTKTQSNQNFYRSISEFLLNFVTWTMKGQNVFLSKVT